MCIMLRHDNFLLSLYKKDIIDVNIRIPCLSRGWHGCLVAGGWPPLLMMAVCFAADEEGVPFFPSSLKMIIDYVVKAQVFDSSPSNLNNLNPRVSPC